jgi:hypothetical protein
MLNINTNADNVIDKLMSNNQIEQIKQFLHNEICERRDYSASKMCEEVLKFIDGGEITIGRNNNPDNTLNMTALRNYITMYLDDIESYGEENELTEATNVLYDFVMYVNELKPMVDGETDESDYEQYMDEYNAMEEESEINDIISMGDQPE